MSPELRNRLVFGAILAGGVAGALTWDLRGGGRWGMLALCLVAAVFACNEFRRLARVHAAQVRLAPMVTVVAALIGEAFLHGLPGDAAAWGPALRAALDPLPVVALILGLGLAWTVLAQMFRYATEDFFANVGATLFGMLYLGLAFNLLLRLGQLAGADGWQGRGVQLVVLLLVAVKFGDIFAYFGGRAFGRHKMSPRISPGKTWEGFASSFVGAVGGTMLVAWLLAAASGHAPFAAWWQGIIWGLVLGPLGVAGDLAESAMKRNAAVKDSGSMLPGFGGVLDLLDAIILAAPAGYLLGLVL